MSYLTPEERKKKINHTCDYFHFESCADLSIGITITPIVPDKSSEQVSQGIVARDVACFTAWWMRAIHPNLNGFSGLDTINWNFK